MAQIIRNPFIVSSFVPEEYFCDRKEETAELCEHICNGHNVALFARRRLGKTGLIRHCFEQKEIKENFNTFIIDIYAAGSLREMTLLLAKEVFSCKSISGLKERKLLSSLRSIRPTVEYSEFTSSFSLGVSLSEIKYPERTLEELINILDSQKKPSVIAIDEFQKIREFKEGDVEACFRTLMQKCKNTTFVFTGSISHSMNNMFKSPDKPFYNSAVMMTIGTIDRDTYRDFALRMFEKVGKRISPTLIEKCYDYFGGVTWYVQLLLNEAFALSEKGNMLTENDFDTIYNAIIGRQDFSYEEQFARLSERQRALLIAVAGESPEGANITSDEFLRKNALGSTSSSQTAGNALKKNNILIDNGQRRQFSDLIFRDWIRRTFL